MSIWDDVNESLVGYILHTTCVVILSAILLAFYITGDTPGAVALEGDLQRNWFLPESLQGDVAVVGNGPVSTADQNDIESTFKHVFVCNRAPNTPIKATHLLVRGVPFGNIGIRRTFRVFPGGPFAGHPTTFNSVRTVISVGPGSKLGLKQISKTKIILQAKTTSRSARMDVMVNGKQMSILPSTGFIAINLALKNSMNQVHVFGMNWNMSSVHNAALEKKLLIANPRVTIHRTASNSLR